MLPDTQFSTFMIIERLGYGGMATVYRATDSRSGQDVALKILHDQYSQDEEVIRRFNREADIFYQLKHPNIVPIVNHGEHESKFYIAMGYMAGGNLFETFSQPKTIESDYTVAVLRQVAKALDFAHSKGVIHRDLKLENVLLDDKNTAYLTDFGIAYITDATRLTTHQTVAGTPLYMSPEQALGISVTPSSDVYSLAVMAYLMTTGYHPFTGRDPYTILNQHVSVPPPIPTSVNEMLPVAINDVLLKGLAKKTSERYPTATAFIDALESALSVGNKTTQTLVRLDALNPQAVLDIEDRQTLLPQPDKPTVIMKPDNNSSNRTLIIVGGMIVIALALVALVVALTGDNNSESAVAIAQTQARREFDLDTTATALAIPPATEVPEEIAPEAIVIRRTDMRETPQKESAFIIDVDPGDEVTLVGRSASSDHIEVRLDDNTQGYIKADSVATDYDIATLPITYEKPSGGGNDNDRPSSRDNDNDGRGGN